MMTPLLYVLLTSSPDAGDASPCAARRGGCVATCEAAHAAKQALEAKRAEKAPEAELKRLEKESRKLRDMDDECRGRLLGN